MDKKRLIAYALMTWPLIGGLVCLFVFAGWRVTLFLLGFILIATIMALSAEKGISLLAEADREDFYRKHHEDRTIGEWEAK